MAPTDPPYGALVEVPPGRGIVKFCDKTFFSPGTWVGIVLSEPKGKNDGSVQGHRYFDCKPNYGVFVRPSQVKIIDPAPASALSAPAPVAAPPRTILGHQRTGSTSGARNSRAAPSSPRAVSPIKAASSGLAGGNASPSSRSTLGSPTKRTPTLSIQSRVGLSRQPSLQADPSLSPTVVRQRSTEFAGRDGSPKVFPKSLGPSPVLSASSPTQTPLNQSSLRRVSSPETESPVISNPPPPQLATPARAQDDPEQELRVRIRVLEAKRAEDSSRIVELDKKLSDAKVFIAMKPKLQAKLNAQQTELIELRGQLADAQQVAQLADSRIVSSQEDLEMAMLDKEMAEERAEAAEADLDEVRERLAVVEVELQVLKDGGGVEEGGESTVKQSLAYIQLEKQNERLKEALIRLRDITQETEQENRRRITEMERDMAGLDDLQAQFETTLSKLTSTETQIEDLKEQLDDALGAEDMVLQLTEQNLTLRDKLEEMRVTIEDLEALKELNDELEENHMETEKAMQDDLNEKDAQIREHLRKIEASEETCQDLEGTVGRFREVVMQLQNELDALREETQTAQHESATAASQTAAMMSLNLRLQSSASKNQARNIDLEVKRIEAREARELLNIVQPYLPQLYVESDMDATSCYMLFQRLALKVDLINTVVAQMHNLPESLNGPVSDVLVGVCEMRGRLSHLSTTCKRFSAIMRKCDVESFLNIGRIYLDVAPMEKRIDMHIELLRREEFRELECVSDAAKIQSQFDHLAETYFNGFDFDLGERELGYALSFDHDLEMFAASVGLIKTSVAAVIKDDDIEIDMGELDPEQEFFSPLQGLLDQCRGAKVLSKKLAKLLEDLTQESSALKSHLIPQLQAMNDVVPELVNFGFSLAQRVMPYLSDVRGAKSPFQLSSILSFVKDIAATTVGKQRKDDVSSWQSVSEFFSQVVQEANQLLPQTTEAENTIKISGTAPWVLRIDEIKAATAVNVEAERKVAQLNDEMQALVRSLKTKDQNIQESAVRIELMERRMETVKKQADTITDLEGELSKARKQERAYEEAMEQLQADLDALEQDNAKLKTLASNPERQPSGIQAPEPENVPVEGSLETSYLLEQIDALRGTVRFLRTENSYLKGQDLLKEIESLPALREPTSREPTPPLVPSGPSDSEDSDSDEQPPPPSLRTLTAESKLLYREVIKYTSSPRVVDLSVLRTKRADTGEKGVRGWMPKKKTPAYQVWERKMEGERLGRRVQGLLERTSSLATR